MSWTDLLFWKRCIPVGWRSIVMSVSVCSSTCISPELRARCSLIFSACYLRPWVAWSSSRGVAPSCLYLRFYGWRNFCTQWPGIGVHSEWLNRGRHRFDTAVYTYFDSPGGSTGPAAKSDIYDCLVPFYFDHEQRVLIGVGDCPFPVDKYWGHIPLISGPCQIKVGAIDAAALGPFNK